MRKHIALILVSLSFLASTIGLTGCGPAHRFVHGLRDTRGEDKLICIDSDLYVEKVYTGEKRRLTHTPDMIKDAAYFALDGKYIIYAEHPFTIGIQPKRKYYIIPSDNDDKDRKEISEEEFGAYR